MGYIVMSHVPGDNPDDDHELNLFMDDIEKYPGPTKVVGLYWIPNRDEETCRQCTRVDESKKNGFGRHPEFGYDTHSCGRPTPSWRRQIGRRLVTALGFNLLEDAETPAIFRDPNQTYRLDRERNPG